MEKMELIDELQVHYEGFAKRMKGRIYYDDQETKSLLEGYAEELASFIFKELDKAREEVFTIDELKFIRNYIATLVPRQKDLTSDGWKMRGDILSKLSKLKTKEDGK